MAALKIRKMVEPDIDEVMSIERDLFSMPWSRASFLFEVSDNRHSYAVVGLRNGTLIGYAMAWFLSNEIHIGNIAVARSEQGAGAGKQLLEHLLGEACQRQVGIATLEVRVSNARAIGLYRRYGFKGIALRRSYYSDNDEDALVMLAEIGPQGPQEPASW
jgi:ribosomal-protein-alanine N-acetyltransferase